MGIRKINPITPGQRFMTVSSFEEITKKTPERSLVEDKKKNAGRNVCGKITVRHQGGGARQKYRIIDFKRNKDNVPAKVFSVEYDPNRSANIALLHYLDGEKRYIIAPLGLKVGDMIVSGETADNEVLDAALIASAQAVEHYEITRYGTLIAWAKELGREDCAQLLSETLSEEKNADKKLSALAEGRINRKAA